MPILTIAGFWGLPAATGSSGALCFRARSVVPFHPPAGGFQGFTRPIIRLPADSVSIRLGRMAPCAALSLTTSKSPLLHEKTSSSGFLPFSYSTLLTKGYLRKLFFPVNDHFMRNGLNVKYARIRKMETFFGETLNKKGCLKRSSLCNVLIKQETYSLFSDSVSVLISHLSVVQNFSASASVLISTYSIGLTSASFSSNFSLLIAS